MDRPMFLYGCQYFKKDFKIKGVIRNCKSKDRQYNGKQKKTKRQTMISKTLHRKQESAQHEPDKM